MRTKNYLQRKKAIDELFLKVSEIKEDQELVSILSKHLCIVVSGWLETSVKEILYNYVQNKSHKHVANFVSKKLKHFSSPNMDNILAVTGSFSLQWKENIETAVEGEIKDAVNSVVANRHNIAHGVDVNVTFSRISAYYPKVVAAVQILEQKCC